MKGHRNISTSAFTVHLSFLIILFFLWISGTASAPKKWQKEAVKAEAVVCHATDETGHSFIPPPEGFLNRLKSGKKTSNIIIQYVNTPDSVRVAIEFASEIWEYLLSSGVPIYMKVSWEPLSAGTLGSCGATNYYVNFDGAPFRDTYYPVAVVEKITEKEMTGPGSPDMVAKFNSSVSWYLGTDGKTPSTKYDLVSTVLHEIAHGLGFTGFFQANTTQKSASYGINDGLPAIYDRYVENFNQNQLTDKTYYKNSSNDLYKAITSNQLYSGSPVAFFWSFENRPRLYAPANYSSGSSIYHLNDANYPYGTINTLMTSGAGKGEAVHSPGPMASGMLADMGWKQLQITYLPLKDREELTDSLEFKILITSDLGIRDHSVYLVYSRDRFKLHRDSANFRLSGNPGNYMAKLLPGLSTVSLTYFITVRDSAGREFTSPLYYPESVYTLTIGPDTIKPVIVHTPVKYALSSADTFEIAAIVTDNLAVGHVNVEFSKDNQVILTQNLLPGENGLYSRKFSLPEIGLDQNDAFSYHIKAVDSSKSENASRLPIQGNFSVIVEKIMQPVTAYSNDFESQQKDFILSDFNISREINFDNYALHTPHPYPSPESDDDSLEFITVLRYPILVTDNGKMSFDEVVLVEPGEEGTVFGDSEFWDYVIVEGSADQGKSWQPLADGYDSGSQTSWLTVYNGKITGNNSTAKGSKELFLKRTISLTGNGNFEAGDTVLIRFRLFSDPYAHGWGWAIDNLNIQNKITSGAELGISPVQVNLWPNPAGNVIHMTSGGPKVINRLDIEISDMTGRVLLRGNRNNILPGQMITFDISKMAPGLLLVRIKTDDQTLVIRKIIKYAE